LAGALFTLLIISVSISYFAKGRNKGKPKVEVPVYDKCFDCGKELLPSVEQVEVTTNASNALVCKECMMRQLDKQGAFARNAKNR